MIGRSANRTPLWSLALLAFAAACIHKTAAHWSDDSGGCSGYPSLSYGSWYWSDGYLCKGRCEYGGEARGECQAGHWNVTTSCPPPPTACSEGDLKYDHTTSWSCGSHDGICYSYCDQGFRGVVKAICRDGSWHYYGHCEIIEDLCHYRPRVYGGTFPDHVDGKDYIEGWCNEGYYGSIHAKCAWGKWVVYGECKKKGCEQTCDGLPPAVSGIEWPNSCYGTSYAKAFCKAGYKPGYVEAKCECGTWVTYGTCQKLHHHNKCYGLPKYKKHAKPWSWKKCNGKSSCSTKCRWGCAGKGYKATCHHGKWKVTGSCYKKQYRWF